MISFWQSENGKIISHTLHEHNSAMGLIKGYIRMIRQNPEKTEEYLLKMEKFIKRAQDAVDYTYTKFKEKYEKEVENE